MDAALKSEEKLDDIMLAMDVVDTLRHEQIMVERDLAAEDRRAALIKRLRGIYKAQGIEVPDSVLMDGVMALEEQRFVYEPPAPGFGLKLAKIYINRRKWLPLVYVLTFIISSVLAINYVGFVRPGKIEIARAETLLSETLPARLEAARGKVREVALSKEAKLKSDAFVQNAQAAISDGNIQAAQTSIENIESLASDLALNYTLRIVSRPGEMSGVFRLNDDGGTEVKNYYLIVEGITAAGSPAIVPIISEENQKKRRVAKWGVRVSEEVFYSVAADKKDDQIIQKAVIGQKRRGYLLPDYSIETSGGTILDW